MICSLLSGGTLTCQIPCANSIGSNETDIGIDPFRRWPPGHVSWFLYTPSTIEINHDSAKLRDAENPPVTVAPQAMLTYVIDMNSYAQMTKIRRILLEYVTIYQYTVLSACLGGCNIMFIYNIYIYI